MKEKLLISACLCGKNTKYNGGNNLIEKIFELEKKYDLYLVCPEVDGGLPVPRVPSEIVGDKVLNKELIDVTKEFNVGANNALKVVIANDIKRALLKDGSPSCGVSTIYDGTFSGSKIEGSGVTVKLLKDFGVKVYSENDIDELLK